MTAECDFLVIGSGVAGLRAALGLAEAGTVVVLTKADPRESNTGYAQGGIAVAIGEDDSPALHERDTMAAGDHLCIPEAVRVLVEVLVVHPAMARVLAVPLVAMTLVPWVAVLVMLWRATPRPEAETLPLRNPLELGVALWYALLLAVLFMLTRALHVWLGEPGVYLLAAVSGVADVDAVSLSLARMAWYDIALAVASHAIVIAVITNTAIKALLASVVGGWALARWVVPILLSTLLVGAALAFYA